MHKGNMFRNLSAENLNLLLTKSLMPKEDVSENVKKNFDFLKGQKEKLKNIVEKKSSRNNQE